MNDVQSQPPTKPVGGRRNGTGPGGRSRTGRRNGRRVAVLAATAATLIVGGGAADGIATVAGPGTAAAVEPAAAPVKPATPPSLPGYTVVTGPVGTVPAGGRSQAAAGCPSGTYVLGGGGSNDSVGHVLLTSSYPWPSATGWQVFVINNGPTDQTFWAYAVCAA